MAELAIEEVWDKGTFAAIAYKWLHWAWEERDEASFVNCLNTSSACSDCIAQSLSERKGKHAMPFRGVAWPPLCPTGSPLPLLPLFLPLSLPDILNKGNCLSLMTVMTTGWISMWCCGAQYFTPEVCSDMQQTKGCFVCGSSMCMLQTTQLRKGPSKKTPWNAKPQPYFVPSRTFKSALKMWHLYKRNCEIRQNRPKLYRLAHFGDALVSGLKVTPVTCCPRWEGKS